MANEIATTDIESFTLPNSDEITLSEIKSEFNKGDKLTDYYGVAAGVPSSGTIKLTDFYGKSSDNTTDPNNGTEIDDDNRAPFGEWNGKRTFRATGGTQLQFSSTQFCHLWRGNGGITNHMGSWGGYMTLSGTSDTKGLYWLCAAQNGKAWPASLLNLYPYVWVGGKYKTSSLDSFGHLRTYAGSWTEETHMDVYGTNPADSENLRVLKFSNRAAGEYMRDLLAAYPQWMCIIYTASSPARPGQPIG